MTARHLERARSRVGEASQSRKREAAEETPAAAEGAAPWPRVRVTWCEAGSHLATNTNREERPPRERQRPLPRRCCRCPRPTARRQRPRTGAARRPPAAVSARRPRGPRPAAGPGAGPPPTPRRPRGACESQSESAGRLHGPSPDSSRGRRPRCPVRPPPGLPPGPPPARPQGRSTAPGGVRPHPTPLVPSLKGTPSSPADQPLSHPRAPNGLYPAPRKPCPGPSPPSSAGPARGPPTLMPGTPRRFPQCSSGSYRN